jgi:Tfp pilus assembly protein PilN
MINLLPPDYKETIIYARRNAALRKWMVALLFALFGTIAIVTGGYLYMDNTRKNQEKELQAEVLQLQQDDLEGTKKQLDEISTNLKLILQVLSREILFSSLMRQLGASLPPNTALQQVKIDKVSGGISLSAIAKDITSATQIQLNLEDPENKIFDKADIENISCSEPDQNNPNPDVNLAYPCTVQLKALFAANNPYVYIQSVPQTEKKP